MSSLKTTFDNIPWRFEDDEFTPVSSSTASWGSPMITDFTFSNVDYPAVRPPRSALSAATLARKRIGRAEPSPVAPPPAYIQNQDVVWQKRLSHAMDEIRGLQQQIESLRTKVDSSQRPRCDDLSPHKMTPTPTPSEPSTPRVRVIPTPSTTSAEPFPPVTTVWKCTTIMLSGHILASFIPSMMVRVLAFGCLANACLFTFMKSRLSNPIPEFKVSLLGLWRQR